MFQNRMPDLLLRVPRRRFLDRFQRRQDSQLDLLFLLGIVAFEGVGPYEVVLGRCTRLAVACLVFWLFRNNIEVLGLNIFDAQLGCLGARRAKNVRGVAHLDILAYCLVAVVESVGKVYRLAH